MRGFVISAFIRLVRRWLFLIRKQSSPIAFRFYPMQEEWKIQIKCLFSLRLVKTTF